MFIQSVPFIVIVPITNLIKKHLQHSNVQYSTNEILSNIPAKFPVKTMLKT